MIFSIILSFSLFASSSLAATSREFTVAGHSITVSGICHDWSDGSDCHVVWHGGSGDCFEITWDDCEEPCDNDLDIAEKVCGYVSGNQLTVKVWRTGYDAGHNVGSGFYINDPSGNHWLIDKDTSYGERTFTYCVGIDSSCSSGLDCCSGLCDATTGKCVDSWIGLDGHSCSQATHADLTFNVTDTCCDDCCWHGGYQLQYHDGSSWREHWNRTWRTDNGYDASFTEPCDGCGCDVGGNYYYIGHTRKTIWPAYATRVFTKRIVLPDNAENLRVRWGSDDYSFFYVNGYQIDGKQDCGWSGWNYVWLFVKPRMSGKVFGGECTGSWETYLYCPESAYQIIHEDGGGGVCLFVNGGYDEGDLAKFRAHVPYTSKFNITVRVAPEEGTLLGFDLEKGPYGMGGGLNYQFYKNCGAGISTWTNVDVGKHSLDSGVREIWFRAREKDDCCPVMPNGCDGNHDTYFDWIRIACENPCVGDCCGSGVNCNDCDNNGIPDICGECFGNFSFYRMCDPEACTSDVSDTAWCPDDHCVYNEECYPSGYQGDVDNDVDIEECNASSNGIWYLYKRGYDLKIWAETAPIFTIGKEEKVNVYVKNFGIEEDSYTITHEETAEESPHLIRVSLSSNKIGPLKSGETGFIPGTITLEGPVKDGKVNFTAISDSNPDRFNWDEIDVQTGLPVNLPELSLTSLMQLLALSVILVVSYSLHLRDRPLHGL